MIALLAGLMAAPAAAKPLCYTPQEVRAMQFRQLQVELMVAALKCQDPELGFRAKYASYINRFGPSLNNNAKQLRAMFGRAGTGERGMDRYMTELSNEASMRALHMEDYCGTHQQMFDKVLDLKPTELEAWAADTVEKPMPAMSCAAPKPANPVKQVKAEEPAKAKPSVKTSAKPAPAAPAKKTESKG